MHAPLGAPLGPRALVCGWWRVGSVVACGLAGQAQLALVFRAVNRNYRSPARQAAGPPALPVSVGETRSKTTQQGEKSRPLKARFGSLSSAALGISLSQRISCRFRSASVCACVCLCVLVCGLCARPESVSHGVAALSWRLAGAWLRSTFFRLAPQLRTRSPKQRPAATLSLDTNQMESLNWIPFQQLQAERILANHPIYSPTWIAGRPTCQLQQRKGKAAGREREPASQQAAGAHKRAPKSDVSHIKATRWPFSPPSLAHEPPARRT